MEETLEVLPWLLGYTVVTSVGGAAIGGSTGGGTGAVTGMFAGPILTSAVLFGALMVYVSVRDLKDDWRALRQRRN